MLLGEQTDKVTELKVVDKNAPYPDLIKLLEDLLLQAMSGHLVGVAAVCVFNDRQLGSVFTEGAKHNIFQTLGGVSYLMSRINNHIEEY